MWAGLRGKQFHPTKGNNIYQSKTTEAVHWEFKIIISEA